MVTLAIEASEESPDAPKEQECGQASHGRGPPRAPASCSPLADLARWRMVHPYMVREAGADSDGSNTARPHGSMPA